MIRVSSLTISFLRSWLDGVAMKGAEDIAFVIDQRNLMISADVKNSVVLLPLKDFDPEEVVNAD